MNYTRYITLDINAASAVTVVNVKRSDAFTRFINVTLMKDGVKYTPEAGVWAMFRCEKPDGHGVITDSLNKDVELDRFLVAINSDGTITIELIDQVTTSVGRCQCDVCLISGNEVLSTTPFVINVQSIPNVASLAISTDDFRTLINAIAAISGGSGSVFDSVVNSINGKTGVVVLGAKDVSALPDTTTIPSKTSDLTNDSGFVNTSDASAAAPVQSVNGQTGDVTVTVPSAASSGTPAMDGNASRGSSTQYARADHIHPSDTSKYTKPSGGIPKTDLTSAVRTSLDKADTALQSVPSTYRTAAAQNEIDAGKLDADQGAVNAGKFLAVGSDGIVIPVTLTEWQGGSY